MLASLFDAVQADVDRQVNWAKGEARRRVRYTARVAILAGTGVLAVIAAAVIGVVALHIWLAAQWTPLIACGMIGSGLLLLALTLFLVAAVGGAPRLAARPPCNSRSLRPRLACSRQGRVQAGYRRAHKKASSLPAKQCVRARGPRCSARSSWPP